MTHFLKRLNSFEKLKNIFFQIKNIFPIKDPNRICQGRWKIDYRKSNRKAHLANIDN